MGENSVSIEVMEEKWPAILAFIFLTNPNFFLFMLL